MILVTGATGNVGGDVVRTLLADTATAGTGRIGALVRQPDRAASLPEGVQIRVGDLGTPASLAPALDGVRAVFLLGGFADMDGVLDQFQRAGVQHVVLLSSRSAAGGDLTNAVERMHIVSERAVRGSGLDWTILRSSGFMSNARGWIPQLRAGDAVRTPFPTVRIAAIDPADIAAVAGLALTSAGHVGQTHVITGPQALVPAEQVAILGAVLGRELRAIAQSDAEARAEMSQTTPEPYVDAFFRFFAEGTFDDSTVLPAVPDLLGRPARTFADWAASHADEFRR